LLPELGVRSVFALLARIDGLRSLSRQASLAALLARDGRVHRTDAIVTVEQR
jgi:hypothetical protein